MPTSLSVNERLKLIKECKHKYGKILSARAKHVAGSMLQAQPFIKDMVITYKSVSDNSLFEPLPESTYFSMSIPNTNDVFDCSIKSINNTYYVHNGYFCLGDNIKALTEYQTEESLVKYLISLGEDKITDIEKLVGDLHSYYTQLCDHIDAIINNVDAEYGMLFSDENMLDLSEIYSKENAAIYTDDTFDDEIDDSEANADDFNLNEDNILEFNIGMQYIPDLASHKYKAYYEVVFRNPDNGQTISFMLHNSKCKTVDKLSAKLLIEPAADYTIYISSSSGHSESRVVDGYGLYNICRYCRIMI